MALKLERKKKLVGWARIVIAVIFQITFRVKIHVNYFFIFKKLFLILTHQNNLKTLKTY
jgi:hypothetical protein